MKETPIPVHDAWTRAGPIDLGLISPKPWRRVNRFQAGFAWGVAACWAAVGMGWIAAWWLT